MTSTYKWYNGDTKKAAEELGFYIFIRSTNEGKEFVIHRHDMNIWHDIEELVGEDAHADMAWGMINEIFIKAANAERAMEGMEPYPDDAYFEGMSFSVDDPNMEMREIDLAAATEIANLLVRMARLRAFA